jgi:hypothetical protein
MQEFIQQWICILELRDILREPAAVQETYVDKLCWHCCHPIPAGWVTLQYPFRVHQPEKFLVGGQFCSWECIKGYGRDDMSRVLSGIHQVNIRHYRKKLTGLLDSVTPAPPRMTLKAFGGHLTIEDFRKPRANVDHVINYAKMTKIIPYETHEYTPSNNKYAKQADRSLVLEDTNVVNDSLKLRRPKPAVKGKSTLERSLGLNSFGNLIRTR